MLMMFVLRLLAPGQVAQSNDVYSYKFILDSVKEDRMLDIAKYKLVPVCVEGERAKTSNSPCFLLF